MPNRKRLQLPRVTARAGVLPNLFGAADEQKRILAVVLKGDTQGSVEAISALLRSLKLDDAEIKIIYSGVGAISKQDLLMALTGSKLVLGFQVGVAPRLEQWVREKGVEIRLYDVIYRVVEDLKELGRNMAPSEPEETVTGKCRVIATFKTDKGAILGCQVEEGAIQTGKNFRIVAAMGPVHNSKIESLQVEKHSVKEARSGQQVGVKVPGFLGAKVGDFIECYETTHQKKSTWTPRGRVVHLKSS